MNVKAKPAGLRVLIVTPVLPPGQGGGGIYTELLASGLVAEGFAARVTILTEGHPGKPKFERRQQGRILILRLFPFRAGRSARTLRFYWAYVIQNLQFLRIRSLVRRLGASHVFVHSSFHNHLSFMRSAISAVRGTGPQRPALIADVRDPKLPPRGFRELRTYDSIICCSENVLVHMKQDHSLSEKLILIPVMIDVSRPADASIAACLDKFGLQRGSYLFNGSGIVNAKGVRTAIACTRALWSRGMRLRLVIAGKRRDWSSDVVEAADTGLLQYLGVLTHAEVLCLSAGCAVDVNLSQVDSMPRASLEAIAIGSKVLLPRGVPEFERDCPQHVAQSDDPEFLAEQIVRVLTQDGLATYDPGPHKPAKVLPFYGALLGGVSSMHPHRPTPCQA